MSVVRASWSNAAFLLYAGGLTLSFAIFWLLVTLAEDYQEAATVGWSALILVGLLAEAFLTRRLGQHLIAGLMAFAAVLAFAFFIGALEDWIGWLDDFGDSPFGGFRPAVLVLPLLTFVASIYALRIFRFPLLVVIAAGSAWYFLTDLVSGGGNWSAFVSIAVGLLFLLVAVAVDADPETRLYGFWLHVAAGLAIGGGLLYFFHDGDLDFAIVALAALLYMFVGERLLRSNWVVLGAWALLQSAAHFAAKWGSIDFFPLFYFVPFFLFFTEGFAFDEGGRHDWAGPIVFMLYALVLIGFGLLIARRRRALPAP